MYTKMEKKNKGSSEKSNENLKNIKKSQDKFIEEIEIPEEITAIIEKEELVMKKEDNELRKKLHPLIGLKIQENKIIIKPRRTTRRDKKMFGTMKAHIKNMIKGLNENFIYRLHIANVHFPMNVSHNKEKNEFIVKNFLGEKKDRIIKLVKGVDVKIDKEIIELSSPDIEKAGQCATNIEKGTKVRNKDRRVYQDGIFIIEKPGRRYLWWKNPRKENS